MAERWIHLKRALFAFISLTVVESDPIFRVVAVMLVVLTVFVMLLPQALLRF